MSDARDRSVVSVTGRPIPLPGAEIDTDQIIPARFMTAVTFDGLGQHVFADLRADSDGNPLDHPMNDPRFQAKGPRVALVNKNFGCGSSREHAPQALWRWGVHALVGESFADIFYNNCVSMGIPCVTATEEQVGRLMAAVEKDPSAELTVSLETMSISHAGVEYSVEMSEGVRHRLMTGTWDATASLVGSLDRVRATASRLPYVKAFRA